MKLFRVDIGSAIARGFKLASVPALTSSFVAYIVKSGWVEIPITYETLGMIWGSLRDMALKSITVTFVVCLFVAILVFIKRVLVATA